MKIFLSIIIPAYNEEKRIPASLLKIISFIKSKPYSAEIIVSDDGSSDQTVQVAKDCLRTSGVAYKVIQAPLNQGKGAAVRAGILAASGEYRLFSDADLSTPIEEVDRFIPRLVSGEADVIIGSRVMKGANIVQHQPMFREIMGRTFNGVALLFAFRGIKDSQCGFKLLTANAATQIFNVQKLDGFSFDVELLYLAQKMGFKILELPVTWVNDAASKVRLLRDPLLMFWDVMRIRWIHRKTQ